MKNYSTLIASAADALAKGNIKKAEKDCRKLVKLSPTDEAVIVLQGIVNLKQSRHSNAEKNFQKALKINPLNQDALNNLGSMYNELGQYDKATKPLQILLNIAPKNAEALNNFGAALLGIAKQDDSDSHRNQSIDFFKKAITNLPTYAVAHKNLGIALLELKDYQGAKDHLQSAVDLDPSYESARSELTIALLRCDMLSEAKNNYSHLADNANNTLPTDAVAEALVSIIETDLSEFDLDTARIFIEKLQLLAPLNSRLADIQPSFHELALESKELISLIEKTHDQSMDLKASSIHYMIHLYHYPIEADTIERLARQLRTDYEVYPANHQFSDTNQSIKKFRLGIFSGDLRLHVVTRFLDAIFDHLDKATFELYVFSFTMIEDQVSKALKSRCHSWTNVTKLSDENCADLISKKQIDALLDLSGHTSPNRAGVLLRKPAKKQISWLGFPSTTGFRSIDYIIGDEITIPPSDEKLYTEKVLRLPKSSLCYSPSAKESETAVTASPRSEIFRFASLNNLIKVNPEVIRAWSVILHRVPGSELLIKDKRLKSPMVQKKVLSWFLEHDINEDRLQFFPRLTDEEHLAFFGKADLALDPFPYNGTTTSCEALHMGLPTLTLSLPGPMISHQGELINKLVGNELFTTYSIDEYVDRAAELASKRSLLEGLRKTSRARMLSSPLCDAPGFCREFEKLLLSL